MPSSVLIIDSPSAPASTQARAIVDDVGDVRRRAWRSTGTDGAVCRRTAPTTSAAARRVAGEDQAAVLDVGAGDVDLDRRDSPGAPRSRRASSAYSSTLPPAMDTTARAPVLVQPGQVVLEEARRCRGPAGRSS